MAIVETLTEDFIGKKVICDLFNEDSKQKKYGVVKSFTEDTISVRINGGKRVVEYSYKDIDLDFQDDEDF